MSNKTMNQRAISRLEERKKKQLEEEEKKKQKTTPVVLPASTESNYYKFDGNLQPYKKETENKKPNINLFGNTNIDLPENSGFGGTGASRSFKEYNPNSWGTKLLEDAKGIVEFKGAVTNQVTGGLLDFSNDFNKALYHLGLKYVPKFGDYFKNLVDYNVQKNSTKLDNSAKVIRDNLGQNFGSDLLISTSQTVGHMVPDLVVTALTAGQNKTVGLAKLAATTPVQKWVNALKIPTESVPLFLSNFGGAYDDAKNNGADDMQALASAVLRAYPQTVIEHSGGMQDLLKGNVANKGWKALVTTSFDEAKEEFLQYPFEEVSKAPYADVKPFSNNPDEQAIINPSAQTRAAAMGGAMGLLFGTGNVIADTANNRKVTTEPPSTETPKTQVDVNTDTTEKASTEMPGSEENVVVNHVNDYESVRRKELSRDTGHDITSPVLTVVTKLTNTQRKLINDAKKAGLDVTFFKSTSKDYDAPGIGRNGSYYKGHIYINVNAENPYRFVLGHEVVHQMKETDTDSYNKLVNIVRNELGPNSDFDSLAADKQEDAVADIMGDIIADPVKYKRVFEQDASFKQKVLDFINNLIARFKSSTENQNGYVSEYTRQLLKARDQLTKIMADSVVNMKGKTDVQHSGNIDIDNPIQYNNVEETLKKDGIIYGSDIHNSTRIGGISDELGNQGRGDKVNQRNVPGKLAEDEIQMRFREPLTNGTTTDVGGVKENSGEKVDRVSRSSNEDETSYRLTGNKTTDNRRYFEAVNTNEELARGMLLEKARQEGFVPVNMYHGTKAEDVFTTFKSGNAIWVTPDLEYATDYTLYQDFGNGDSDIRKQLHTVNGSNVYDLFVKADKILDVGNIENEVNNINELFAFADSIGFSEDEILKCWNQREEFENRSIWTITNTPLFAEYARKRGYDALKAVEGNGITSYGILYKGNVKSAKTVTYDDNKNIIPLSERFNTKKDDIRHSVMRGKVQDNIDESGRNKRVKELTPGFNQDWVKIRKGTDKDGNVIYDFDIDSPSYETLKNDERYQEFIRNAITYKDVCGTFKTTDRAFEKSFGDQFENFNNTVISGIEKSKMQFQYLTEFFTNSLYDNVIKKLGIKNGSKQSLLVREYGEGRITLEELKSLEPKKYQDIVKADRYFRTMYDTFIDNLNKQRAKIYPNVEKTIKAYQDKLDSINEKLDLIEMGELEKVFSIKANRENTRFLELMNIKNKLNKNCAETIKKIDEDISVTKQTMTAKKRKDTETYFNLQKRLDTLNERKNKILKLTEISVKNKDNAINKLLGEFNNIGEKRQAELSAMKDALLREKEQIETTLEDESLWRGKRIPKRKDYYRHTGELAESFGNLKSLLNSSANIATELVGKSEFTKPKSKFLSIGQQRTTDETDIDAVGGFLDYLPSAIYAMTIDPNIDIIRQVRKDLEVATKDTRNMNKMLMRLDLLANEFAGKTVSGLDRLVQDRVGRTNFRNAKKFISRLKRNATSSFASAVSQFFNLPNGIAIVRDKKALAGALTDSIKNDNQNNSPFLKERYSNYYSKFDTKIYQQPKKLIYWVLGVGDEISTRYIWNAAYRKGVSKGVADPIKYADSLTRRAVGGRGLGEKSLSQQSSVFTTIFPFTLEGSNALQVQIDFAKEAGEGIKDKDLRKTLGACEAFLMLYIGNAIMNAIKKELFGSDGGLFNPFGIIYDNFTDDELTLKEKFINSGKEIAGNFLATTVAGQKIAELYPEDGMKIGDNLKTGEEIRTPSRADLFGTEDPTRFGTSNLLTSALKNPLTSILPPVGGSQIKKSYEGIKAVMDGGVYADNGNLKYPIDKTLGNYVRAGVGGKSALPETQQFYDSSMKSLTDSENEQYIERCRNGETPVKVYQDIINVRKKKESIKQSNMFYKVMNEGKVFSLIAPESKAVYNEIIGLQERLTENETDVNVMFSVPDNKFEYNGKQKVMTADEYSKYLDDCSKSAFKGLNSLTKSNYYKKASDKGKAEMVKDIYEYARAVSKTSVDKGYTPDSQYQKMKYADENGIGSGEYVAYKAQLPKNYTEADAYNLAKSSGYDKKKVELLTNLLSKFSYEECMRIEKAGGFKYADGVRKMYSDMKKIDKDCDTLYAPIAEKEFKYTNKKAGIKYEATLSDKELLGLQKLYLRYYEQALDRIMNYTYYDVENMYKAVKSARDDARDAAKLDFYYQLQR